MRHFNAVIFIATILCFTGSSAQGQYVINDVFGDLNACDTMTRGIYIVWWDKNSDLHDKVDVLLDTMMSYRDICLQQLDMADPPNPEDGYYYNVYLHDSGYFGQYQWGNGQGTDVNGYPFLTLPAGLANDWPNTAHETFHIFQYQANSPGFAYSGDSQWYIEASANWFAARQNPDHPRRFVEAESLVRVPQVPFWLSYDNYPNTYPSNWQRYVHQYALALFLYYLTDVKGINEDIITSGLYGGTDELPQEYMYNQLGADTYRRYFIDWAAHMTNHFDFILAYQAQTNLNEWNDYADPVDDHQYTRVLDNEGIEEWYTPDGDEITNAWSFNTYKLINNQSMMYTFQLKGETEGSYGDPSRFGGKLLVQNSETGSSFYDLAMSSETEGELTLSLTPEDTAVYFIVASIPDLFSDEHPMFQLFPYSVRILKEDISATEDPEVLSTRKIIARYNLLGQVVSEHSEGMQVIVYNDFSAEVIFVKE